MADMLTLAAEPREKVGKGSARAARRAGRIPAVIYGAKKTPQAITVKRNELVAILNRGGFLSHTFEIDVAGKAEQVLPRDIHLHPVTDEPLHVDFLRLTKGAKVTVNVPVHFEDEDECPGIKRGGVLNVVRYEVEVEAPATAIPEALTASLKGLDINDAVRISDVSLPEGCAPTITDRDFTLATISAPTVMTAEEEEEGAEEAEAEAAEAQAEEAEGETEGDEGGEKE